MMERGAGRGGLGTPSPATGAELLRDSLDVAVDMPAAADIYPLATFRGDTDPAVPQTWFFMPSIAMVNIEP